MPYTITINGEELYANDLARMAGVSYPDGRDSAGARWLMDVADSYVEVLPQLRDEVYPHDYLSELADSAVPVSTHEQWQVWTDLTLYQLECDAYSAGTELTYEAMQDLPCSALLDVAEKLMIALWGADTGTEGEDDE